MKIAITGGTGFIGGYLVRTLVEHGHEIVIIARGMNERVKNLAQSANLKLTLIGTGDEEKLSQAMVGCEAVVHLAGINREIGAQTYQLVHVEGTRKVASAAKQAGVKKMVLLSYLTARPGTDSPYHESKWEAEEIVRTAGLDYTILKPGMIFGQGDHMLDHISHSLCTFPIFGSVGFREKPVRPVAVQDVNRILVAAVEEDRLSNRTAYIVGPEELVLSEAVRRVGHVMGKTLIILPTPLLFLHVLSWFCEALMRNPLLASAQVKMLSESGHWAGMPETNLPEDLVPKMPFGVEQIRNGLPKRGSFGLADFKSLPEIFGRAKASL